MNLNQIEPNLFVGSCPQHAEDVERLRNEHGITAVLNVQTDEDLDDWGIHWDQLRQAYEETGIVLRHEPVRDFDPEALRRRLPDCVRALAELVNEDHTVYVHCSYGINRSPTTVIAYLHRCEDWDLGDAVGHVLRNRPCDPLVHTIATADWDGTERG
jgi:protein-tyrosine phosphatase